MRRWLDVSPSWWQVATCSERGYVIGWLLQHRPSFEFSVCRPKLMAWRESNIDLQVMLDLALDIEALRPARLDN